MHYEYIFNPPLLITVNIYDKVIVFTANDRGEGYLEGSCSGGVLTITLRATKAVEFENVQWAADEWVDWQRQHGGMNSCTSEVCELSPDGKTMTIRVPGSGTMAFAVNVIYGYILPNDWISNPELATCVGKYSILKWAPKCPSIL